MLKDVNRKPIIEISRKRLPLLNSFKKQISTQEFNLVIDEIQKMFDKHEPLCSSWSASNNWDGTAKEYISNACKNNITISSQIYGLLVFETAINREDTWIFYKDYDDGKVKGSFYFPEKDN